MASVYFVLLFQSLISSGTHIIAKLIVKDVEPVTLTMLRSSMAALALLPIILIRKSNFTFAREHYPSILLLSFLAIPVNQFLFLTAMRFSTPSNAALLYGTTPVVVLLISYISGRERLTTKKTIGVAVAFCGAMAVIFEHGINVSSSSTLGNVLLALAVVSWALYTVGGREMVLRYGAFSTSASTMVIGTLMYLPIGFLPAVRFDYSGLTWAHWGGLLYLSLGTSIFSYFLWYYALERIEASKVAIFSNLQPVLTTILAAIVLSQPITLQFVIGGSIAVAGVLLTQFG